MRSFFALVSVSLASLAMQASASCIYGTTLHRRQTDVPVSSYTFGGTTGPINWAGLKPEYRECALGHNQSPINFNQSIPFATEIPQINIPSTSFAEFLNIGSTVQVFINGTTMFGGKTYHLIQYHFHTPSEHRIENEYYPLEMHMVHEADDGAHVVVGVLFQLSDFGLTTDFVRQTIVNIDGIREPGTRNVTGYLDFSELVEAFQSAPIYQYTGSLTTPPCTEGITFLTLAYPMVLDVASYNLLKSVMKFNARYIQNAPGEQNLLQISAREISEL
ncbi:hypothetical protein D9758_004575 [Tetrapyrgos nigripes]|uniref:Carbonic anhydrase n=1 Tax=Tetrapyrgos nigripes TaxID=182062 RepID=A0A8H5LYI9_9AGAR|nr:hypothetical protein D9758_004575 [Tetrapyrgos nigripes]